MSSPRNGGIPSPAHLVEDDLAYLPSAVRRADLARTPVAALAVVFGRLTAARAFVAFFFVFFIPGVPSFGTKPLTIRVSREKASANLGWVLKCLNGASVVLRFGGGRAWGDPEASA